MNTAFIQQQIMEYAQSLIAPLEIVHIEQVETISDENGDTDVWQLSCDTGEEYWVLQGDHPANIFKKSGIYENIAHVYDVYIAMQEEESAGSEVADRYHYH